MVLYHSSISERVTPPVLSNQLIQLSLKNRIMTQYMVYNGSPLRSKVLSASQLPLMEDLFGGI